MAFKIVWHPNALKSLDKLQNETALRIVKKINESKEDPFRFAERLAGMEDYKIRVGNFRIFVEIETNSKEVRVLAVRHRKNAYKR